MPDTYTTLTELVESFKADDDKFNAGTAAAASRARKTLQSIIAVAKERRKSITDEKNARKAAKQK